MTAPELTIVDEQTGELRAAGCPQCAELASRLAGAEADLAAIERDHTRQLRRIDALLRDRDAERLGDPQRTTIMEVFDYWKQRCGHPNARFDGRRHDLIKARLQSFSVDELKMAIDGAAVDAFTDAKGTRHDRLGLILRDSEHVEGFCNRYARWKRRNGEAAC